MPRSKSYDPDDALEAAMRLFWQKGYTATSVSDLTEATGLNRFSLYNEFVDKSSLFSSALDRYLQINVSSTLAPVEAPEAGPDGIRAFFERLSGFSTAGLGEHGCLLCNTISELGPEHESAAPQITAYSERLRSGFAACLASGANTERLADYFVGVTMGFFSLAKSGASPEALTHYVETALSTLD